MLLMSDNDGLVEAVKTHWDQRKRTGKHLRKVAEWVENEHPGSAVGKMLRNINGLMDKAKIKKATSLNVGYEQEIKRTEDYQGACAFCKTNFKEGTKVSFVVDGRNLTSGTGGDQIGLDCYSHLTYIAQALESDKFEMYEQEPKKEKRTEYFGRAFMTLGQLPRKAVQKLREWGFDLNAEIAADIVKDLTQRIEDDDRTAVRYEIDPHKSEDMIGWLIGNITHIYEPRTRQAAIVLGEQPHLLTTEQWGALILYAWQEQLLKAEGELRGTKEDILYLAEPKEEYLKDEKANAAREKVLKKYGSVALDDIVKPIKAFDKARWEEVTIRDVLNRGAVTKAQVRAARAAVPYLKERREIHNRDIIDSYGKQEEVAKLFENLRVKYEGEDGKGGEKKRYYDAKVDGIKNPETCWTKETYKIIRDFFELRNEIKETGKGLTPRETLIGYVDMPRAVGLAKSLYIEGKKLKLADKTRGESILKDEYMTIDDAAARIDRLGKKVERFLGAALEFDEKERKIVPAHTGERYKKARMKQDKIKTLRGDLHASGEWEIVATRYLQKDGETASELERALEITTDYIKDREVAKHVAYFKKLQESCIELRIAASAEDETCGERGVPVPFDIDVMVGKTYFSPEQVRIVNELWDKLPNNIKNINLKNVEERMGKVDKFYREREVYGIGFVLEECDKRPKWCGSFSYVDLKELRKKEMGTRTCKKISEELKGKLTELNQQKARDFLKREEHDFCLLEASEMKRMTRRDDVYVTLDLERGIGGWYTTFKEQERKVGENREKLRAAGYDVEKIKIRLEILEQQRREPKSTEREAWPQTTKQAREYVKRDMGILEESFVKSIADAIAPERLVLRECDIHTYRAQNANLFHVVAHGDGSALLNAFGKTANKESALLRYAAERGNLAGMMYEKGSWYRPSVTREMLKKMIEKADATGNITIAIEVVEKK